MPENYISQEYESAPESSQRCAECGAAILRAAARAIEPGHELDLPPPIKEAPMARNRARIYAPIRSPFVPDSEGRRHLGDDQSGVVSYRIDTRPPGMYMLLDDVLALTAEETRVTASEQTSQSR